MVNPWLLVAIGGALGAMGRYGVNRLVMNVLEKPWTWATLIVNVLGCLLMGMAYAWLQNRPDLDATVKLLLMVGFLGALTTWSTFSMEAVLMIQSNQWLAALGYTLLTCLLCFVAFWLGVKL